MGLQPSFFRGMKVVVAVLAAAGVVGAILAFLLVPGVAGRFYGIGALVLVLNLGLMYFFISVNDKKRPEGRTRYGGSQKGELPREKRFDFRKRDS